ncbi:hypothetical protein KF707_21465 [Candidatus Obscuribacterales bacterium]|nr:hypothetical protein [Candidatus Obscuribacterales bacterium]MBX3150923.1 hypothetical protein [Candidatus Obscuribacterales bacterium]
MSIAIVLSGLFPSVSLAESRFEKQARTNQRMLERALLNAPNDANLLMAKVNYLIAQKSYDAALSICAEQLKVAPVQAVHELSDYALHYYSSVQAVPTRGKWLCRKAEIEYELDRFDEALEDCEASLATYCEERTRAYFLKSRILSAMGRLGESCSAFDTGVYLVSESSSRDRYPISQYMRDTALQIGVRKDPIKESVDSYVDSYAAEKFQPRIEHADDLLEIIYKLANLKAPDSVAQLRGVLNSEVCYETRKKNAGYTLFAPSESWRSGYFVKNIGTFARNELNLKPDILYACVSSDKVKAKFGEPYRTDGIVFHSDPTSLRYITPEYELIFSFSHSGSRALMNVQVLWSSDEYKTAVAEAKVNRQTREAAEGIESVAIVQNVRQLIGMELPTKEVVEKLFGHKLNPFRLTEPRSWSLGYQNPNYNGPVDTDYQLTFAPLGTVDTDAQLQISPGTQNHKINRKQVESVFPCTIISTEPSPKPSKARLTKASYKGKFASLTMEFDNNQPGSPVGRILLWWQGKNAARTLEEYEKEQSVNTILVDADCAISQRDFERARFLLDRAFNRAENSGQRTTAFEQLSKVRAGYLKLFTYLKKPGEIAYLKKVSCAQLRGDLLNPEELSLYDGVFFPTDRQLRGRWRVNKNSSGSSLECTKLGMFMARNAEDETAMRKLYPYGTDGSFDIECPPAQLVDSMYFDLMAK